MTGDGASVSLCPSQSSRQRGEGAGVVQSVKRPLGSGHDFCLLSSFIDTAARIQNQTWEDLCPLPYTFYRFPVSPPPFKSLLLFVCLFVTAVIYCRKQPVQ